jgi:hypothetical protein
VANRNHIPVVVASISLLVRVAIDELLVTSVILVVFTIPVVRARPSVDAWKLLAHGALVVDLMVADLVLRGSQVVEDVLDVHVGRGLVA